MASSKSLSYSSRKLTTGSTLAPDRAGSGLYRSEAFPGLWLDPAALVRGDLATVLTTLQDGLSSPEHSAFVTRLGA